MVIILLGSMFPSSSRVKLNRVAFKELIGLKLVPRRRRVQRSQDNATAGPKKEEQPVSVPVPEKDTTSVHSSIEPLPEVLTDTAGSTPKAEPEENCVCTESAKSRYNLMPGAGKDSMVYAKEGRRTRGKYQHRRPNTRSKGKLNSLRSLCDLRLRFTWCFCTGADNALIKGSEVDRRLKPRSQISKMANKTELNCDTFAKNKASKTHRSPDLGSSGKLSGRRKSRQANIKRKAQVTNVGERDGDRHREFQGKLKARSSGCDRQPAAGNTGSVQAETLARPIPTELSNPRKNTHLSPAGLTDSEAALRRAVRASGCGLCGDCKYTSPQRKTLGKPKQKNSSPGPKQPTVEFKLEGKNTDPDASQKIIIWIDPYPKVALYDIAQKCDTGMRDRHIEQDPGPNYPHRGPEIFRDKRIKLGDSGEDGILPSTPHLESIIRKNPITSDSKIEEKAYSCESRASQSGSEHVIGVASSSTFGPDVTVNIIHNKQFDEIESPTNLLSQSTESDTDEPESFTCQRVRVYSKKIQSSCSRTYMPWPFSKSSWTLTSHAETTAHHAEYFDPLTKDNCSSSANQKQSDLSNRRTNDVIPHLPTDLSTDGLTHHISHQNENKKEQGGKCILAERNGIVQGDMSSYSSERKDMEFAPHLREGEESQASLSSDTASLSNPSQYGTVSPSSSVVSGPKTDSSTSTPSPTALGLRFWDTATSLPPMSSPFTPSGLNRLSNLPPSLFLPNTVTRVEFAEAHSACTSPGPPSPTSCAIKSAEKPLLHCEHNPMISCHNSETFPSSELSLNLLPQEEQDSDGELLTDRFPPKLEPFYNTSPYNHYAPVKERSLHNVSTENCVENNSTKFMLPPVLSPVTSPKRHSPRSILPGLSSSDEEPLSQETEEEEISKEPNKHKMLIEFNSPHIVDENLEDDLEHVSKGIEGVSRIFKTVNSARSELQSSPLNDEDSDNDGDEEESPNETDYEEEVEQVNKVHSDPKIKANLCLDSLAECCSSSSDQDEGGAFSDEDQPCSSGEEASSPCKTAGGETDEMKSSGLTQDILNEFTAYEQDILLVDVIQDDPELFENLPQTSVLKLGPIRNTEASKSRPTGGVKTLWAKKDGASISSEKRLTPVNIDFHCDSPDNMDESRSRSWRPQCNGDPATKQSSPWTDKEKQTKTLGQPDANNNHVNGGLERITLLKTVTSQHNHISTSKTIKNGPRSTNPVNGAELRRQQSNSYCRQYFSESLSCGFRMCWFLHIPVDGDEKFCIETVIRFTKNPVCLQRAGAVFTGYYQNNPLGVYFSMPVLLSLLWALLKAGMVSDVFSVLSISLAHKKVPGPEFVLALFNYVREKSLLSLGPELMQLTFKMVEAGLVLDCLDCVKNTPEFQQTNSHVSGSGNGNQKLSTSAPFPEYLNLAHSVVEIELCTKQEDWRRMGEVFRSICQSSQRPNQVERISGRITIALLSESKDKLSLPFATFAETVCQNEEEGLNRSFLGRIGVSLMLRYHKTHQWAKGRRVVEVLANCKVNYSNLKGLFGNEDATSRCFLVTVATELFLLSGSVEGALNTLRENKWFVSSSGWPCEPADLESRTRVLMRLAEKSSHRDSLDVLSNLPGLKEPNDLVDISMYAPLFNSHLQVCLDRQILPVASDTVDFMCSKNLAVDQTMLQKLLHKLGKQNLWLRAREVFRHTLSVGYYPGVSAPPGFMSLIVPCRLGEVELALTFEMFITVNATVLLHLPENTTSCLSITLKRTQSCESEYLTASSRLLSAACIPHPKLDVVYTAVNSSQEQVFNLDITSARAWLRQNHLWANEVWTH